MQSVLDAIKLGPPATVWIVDGFADSWKSGAAKLLSAVQRREDLSESERQEAEAAENELCEKDLSITTFLWGKT